MAAGIVLLLLWPGNVPWVRDEPIMLHHALVANQQGHLVHDRLQGTTGVLYHPAGMWTFQALLLVSRNPVHVAFVKALLSALLTLGGCLVLGRAVRWRRWPLALIPVCPWLYLWHRHLWDNVQLIPAAPWLALSLVQLHRTGRARWLYLGLALGVWMFHVHIIAAPLIAAWGVTVLVTQWRCWRRLWPHALAGAAAAGLVTGPYLLSFLHVQTGARFAPALAAGHLAGLANGWFGIRLFTGIGLADVFPDLPTPGLRLVVWLTWLGIPLFATGLFAAGRQRWRHRGWGAGDVLCLFAALTILAMVGLFTITRQLPLRHYFNGVWLAWFVFIWRALAIAVRTRTGRALVALWAAALIVLTVSLAVHVQIYGGTRGHRFGPTLATQWSVATRAVHYTPTKVDLNAVENYRLFPHALPYLVDFAAAVAPVAAAPPAALRVHYLHPDSPHDAHLTVDVAPQ